MNYKLPPESNDDLISGAVDIMRLLGKDKEMKKTVEEIETFSPQETRCKHCGSIAVFAIGFSSIWACPICRIELSANQIETVVVLSIGDFERLLELAGINNQVEKEVEK